MAAGTSRELLERESELDALRAAVDLLAGGSASVVVVRGPAGIGKTRLLGALAALAGDRGMATCVARGSELERDFPLGVVRHLIEPAIALVDDGERELLFEGAAALARRVFDHGAVDAPDTGFQTLHGLYWLVVNLAQRTPLLLLIDDVHWADAASLRFLAFLTRRLEGLPVGVALGVRAGDPGADSPLLGDIAAAEQALTVTPRPLSREAVAKLVSERLGELVDPEFAAAVHEGSGGNPLWLRELLATVRERGVRPVAGEAGAIRALGSESIARIVLARLGRLDAAAPALARAVAVLGEGCSLRHAARLAALGVDEAVAGTDALVRAEILRPGPELGFTHPVVRASIYLDLSAPQRAEAHSRAAELLDAAATPAERIAPHVALTEPRGDQRRVKILCETAGAAMARGAPDAAAAHLRRALAEPPADDRQHVLQLLGTAELLAGDPEAADHLRLALELLDDPVPRAQLASLLGAALTASGRIRDAAATLDRAAREVESADVDLALRLEGEAVFVMTLDLSTMPLLGARLERFGDVAGDTAGERLLLAAMAHHAQMTAGSAALVRSLAIRAMGDGRLLFDAAPDAPPFYLVCSCLIRTESHDLVARVVDAAIEDARRRGSPRGIALGFGQRAILENWSGRVADAEADARISVDAAVAGNLHEALPALVDALATSLIERADHEQAAAVLAEHGFDGELPHHLLHSRLLETRGRLKLATDRPREALEDLLELSRRFAGSHDTLTRWRVWAARAMAVLGEFDEAHRLAAEALEVARAFDTASEIGVALSAAAAAEPGDRRIVMLADAVKALEASPARLEHARAEIELGVALRGHGQRGDAREWLTRGLERARRLGALALERQAAGELAALGGRPPREATTGIGALTPSERRVAEMAAQGMSNKQIAQALFVTLKTVEIHLTRAYRKLGITSRVDLPQVLEGGAGRTPLS